MDAAEHIDAVDAALLDADATLSTDVGGHQELTNARLWRGEVRVDWEPDPQAGGCLLRPALLRRLVALHAATNVSADSLRLTAPGRIVAALSPAHADLVRRLGGARRIELTLSLRFSGGDYRGGEEIYALVGQGKRRELLRLEAQVTSRKVAANVACDEVIGPSSRV